MCLIVLAWRVLPSTPLLVAANRDEFHVRSASPAAYWEDHPDILAGRDLQAMGTWMGVSRSGRFAAVTNYRGAREPTAAESRGALVTGFLLNGASPAAYVAQVKEKGAKYSGFNLLACDGEDLWWLSNRDGSPRRLEPGYYALGNLLLDSPEVQTIKGRVAATQASVEPLFSVLGEAKIVHPEYGTRCSTVLLRGENALRYSERTFLPDGSEGDTRHYHFSI